MPMNSGHARTARADADVTVAESPVDPAVRIVHLGLGNFFRAHQAWYTQHASDGPDWGIAAFAGRNPHMADVLNAQGGRYSFVIRGPTEDHLDTIDRVVRAHRSDDDDAWSGYFASERVAVVTLTVTESAYLHHPTEGVDWSSEQLRADVSAIAAGAVSAATVPARIAAGLMRRRAADAGPLALISCDNLLNNGAVFGAAVRAVCHRLDPSMDVWLDAMVTFPSAVVDRITPRATPELLAMVEHRLGARDDAAVVAEPYSEWTMTDAFLGARPDWEGAGARYVADVEPFERRKLWLLNAAHTLLAYTGIARGITTVHQAMDDAHCVTLVRDWWAVAGADIGLPREDVEGFCAALEIRFRNARNAHQLLQISLDGSQKLPIRILPVLAVQRQKGGLPRSAVEVLAAWVWFVRNDDRAEDVDIARLRRLGSAGPADAVRELLSLLDTTLEEDDVLLAAVTQRLHELERAPSSS